LILVIIKFTPCLSQSQLYFNRSII